QFSMRAYDDEGQTSDDAAQWAVRPFDVGTAPTGEYNDYAGTYATAWDGRIVAIAAAVSGAEARVFLCDTDSSDCSSSASWTDVLLFAKTFSPLVFAGAATIANGTVWATFERVDPDTFVRTIRTYRCPLSAGC